jgi:hypothetical protein
MEGAPMQDLKVLWTVAVFLVIYPAFVKLFLKMIPPPENRLEFNSMERQRMLLKLATLRQKQFKKTVRVKG